MPRNLRRRLAEEKAARRRRFLADLGERTVRTFAQGFLGVVTLDAVSTRFDATLREKLLAGLLAGAYAVIAALAAKPVGASDSASFLPADVDPPQGDDGHVDPVVLLLVLVAFVIGALLF